MNLEHPGVTDAHGVHYEPWSDGYAIGFKATHPDGRSEYVYLNPTSESDDGISNVFVYHGPNGKPALDSSVVYIDIHRKVGD